MGNTKKENEKQLKESKYSCYRCGEKILKNDLRFSKQENESYLCPDCRAELEKVKRKN